MGIASKKKFQFVYRCKTCQTVYPITSKLIWKTSWILMNVLMTLKRSAEVPITILSFTMATEIKMETVCHFPHPPFLEIMAEIVEVQIILQVVEVEVVQIMRVVQLENDTSSRWSCEKFAELGLLHETVQQFAPDMICWKMLFTLEK